VATPNGYEFVFVSSIVGDLDMPFRLCNRWGIRWGLSHFLLFATTLAMISALPLKAGMADVKTTIEIDRPLVLKDDDKPVYILVRFTIPEKSIAPREDRQPVNISLVLDRSGSMGSERKIQNMKAAVKDVIDRLGVNDRVSIVEYDDVVTVTWPSAPVEAPILIKKVIDNLTPRNATNLSGGMLAGVDQVRKHLSDNAINRVFLLSDGLANRGVKDPYKIRTLVRNAKSQGVSITTLGLGVRYNEDLMQDIAKNGGGNYHYIEGASQMAAIFQRELSTLFRTMAKDVDLRFIPAKAVTGVQVFGYTTRTDHGATVIELSNFHSGESRNVVIRLDLEKSELGPLNLGKLQFSYKDAEDGERTERSQELTVSVTEDREEVQKAANKEPTIEAALMESEKRHEESLGLLQNGKAKKAKEQIKALVSNLKKRNATLQDIRIAKKIEALEIESKSVERAAAAPTAAGSAAFMKRSKQRLYQAQQGKRSLYLMRPGDKGHNVKDLQKALKKAGKYDGPMDGLYSKKVEDAVRTYQKDAKQSQDGIAGPATLNGLGLY
jgi:Ca-activated chloride channel family protein